MAVHRPTDARDYGSEDKRRLTAFLPHLKRALQIRQRLLTAGVERRATLDALERTGTATLVVTQSGHILYANALAEGLLRQTDAIRAINGRLVTVERTANASLSLAIAEAIRAAGGNNAAASNTLTIAREDRLPLTLMVAPLRPAGDGFGAAVPCAIVFVRDPEQPTPSSQALRGLFGLTPAEASIAAALADGLSLDSIAASHRVSLNTARTHLKNILAKTGTRRQAELVALVLRSAAVLTSR